jgi:condensin complex subunit 3
VLLIAFAFSEDLYQKLKKSLFERVRDKEYSVRIQAVTALSRLQNADDEEDEVDGRTVSEKLIDIMQHDPSAYVPTNFFYWFVFEIALTLN